MFQATFFPEPQCLDFKVQDLTRGDTLSFYCLTKKSRPWLALYLKKDGEDLTVQWLKKSRNCYIPEVLNDGSAYTSVVSYESIMLTGVLVNMSPSLDWNGPYKMENHMKLQITEAYKERDLNLVN